MIEIEVEGSGDVVVLARLAGEVTAEDHRVFTARLDALIASGARVALVVDPSAKTASAPGAKKVFVRWMLERQAVLAAQVVASTEVVDADGVESGRKRLAALALPWPAELFTSLDEALSWARSRLEAT